MRGRPRHRSLQCRATSANWCTTSLRSMVWSRSRTVRAQTATPCFAAGDVSRETFLNCTERDELHGVNAMDAAAELEVEPAVAVELFGDRIDVARQFTTALARAGEERGLIGPLELPRLWTRHILNSVIAAPLFR